MVRKYGARWGLNQIRGAWLAECDHTTKTEKFKKVVLTVHLPDGIRPGLTF